MINDVKKTKVLIVDDSAFMRNALKSMITSDREIEVVGMARDGMEAIDMMMKVNPDIITLDVEMPKMDGIETLKVIMSKRPVPVIMVSSLTIEGAKTTLDALELGAVDFIPKNLSELSINIMNIKQMLIDKIKGIASKGIKMKRRASEPRVAAPLSAPHGSPQAPTQLGKPGDKAVQFTSRKRMQLIAIGTSTGGPKALQTILPVLPKSLLNVPIVISQHMPPNFTGPFSERLNQLSQVTVREAKSGDKLENGVVYIAPGIGHMSFVRKGIDKIVQISEDKEYIYRPSVDVMMLSVAALFPGSCLGVILTGMGNDGLKGMTAIKESGGRTIAQDEDSCVVYGMPKAVVDAGMADKVVPLTEIAGEIINSV